MKKTIAVIIAVFQLLALFQAGIPLASASGGDPTMEPPVMKVKGLYSLFTVACGNTLSTLKNIAELADLISGLHEAGTPPDPQPSESPASRGVTHMPSYSGISNPDARSVSFFGNDLTDRSSTMLSVSHMQLTGMALLLMFGVFLYLHRLKYFLLNARSAIDDIRLLLLSVMGTPHLGFIQMRGFHLIGAHS